MTLLGANGFQMGVKGPSSSITMDMSLDDMIKSRQSEQPKGIKKSVSNTDKSIGTSRAKRNANQAARRGTQANTKPTNVQVEQEVKKQVAKSIAAKVKATSSAEASSNTVTGEEKSKKRRAKRALKKQMKEIGAPVTVLRPPSKKQIAAAVGALQSSGFTIPEGQQMVISFSPIPGTVATTIKGPPPSQKK